MSLINKTLMRKDTAALWTASNPILVSGAYGIETDTGYVKKGDGSTAWSSLAYKPTEDQPIETNVPAGIERFFSADNIMHVRSAAGVAGSVYIGASATPVTETYNGNKMLAVYSTCASTNTSTSFEPVLFSTVMTGAGQVGGRVKVLLSTDVVLGGWANAFKAQVNLNTSGRCTGLMSVGCLELNLPASDVSGVNGTYAALETELIAPTSCVPSAATNLWYNNLTGAAVATLRANMSLWRLDGMGSATSATNVFHTTGTVSATHGLRISIDGVAYDLLMKASTYA